MLDAAPSWECLPVAPTATVMVALSLPKTPASTNTGKPGLSAVLGLANVPREVGAPKSHS